MERLEKRFIDKSEWGDGPWQNEPDKIQWTDEATGYPCLIVRQQYFGHLCGYVGVPEGHPYFKKPFHDVHLDSGHGSVNFSESCDEKNPEQHVCHVPAPGEPDLVWWFGFDCGHFQDASPAKSAREREMGIFHLLHSDDLPDYMRERYRDVPYVSACCAELAAELKHHEHQ